MHVPGTSRLLHTLRNPEKVDKITRNYYNKFVTHPINSINRTSTAPFFSPPLQLVGKRGRRREGEGGDQYDIGAKTVPATTTTTTTTTTDDPGLFPEPRFNLDPHGDYFRLFNIGDKRYKARSFPPHPK